MNKPITRSRCYLRTLRRNWGLTQKELANIIGTVSTQQISRYENSKRAPKVEVALACQAIFGVPPSTMFPDAYTWVLGFVRWYNTEHHHSAIAFVTPSQRHDGRDIAILEQRQRLYEDAKQRHQSRWSGSTRNWQRPAVVSLNPERQTIQHKDEKLKIAA